MLQQTTSRAVIPYFEKFITKFPTVHDLADAEINEVLELWAGLGYYSRAKNLHKAAKEIAAQKTFPKSFQDLLSFPGIGPYTSRAVSSIAFEEPVGVIDGNVIRVLSRYHNKGFEWWRTQPKTELQNLADKLAQQGKPSLVNQALMELGATVCTPKSPSCILCPWLNSCKSQKAGNQESLPIKKQKKTTEIILWQPEIYLKKGKILLTKNNYAPFLKNQWMLPGTIKSLKAKPKTSDYKHAITHYSIYVQVKIESSKVNFSTQNSDKYVWVKQHELKKWSQTSLVEKAISFAQLNT